MNDKLKDAEALREILNRRDITGLLDMLLDITTEQLFAAHDQGDNFSYQAMGFRFAVLTEARLRFINRR